MLSNNLVARRLQKQEQSLKKQQIQGVLVHRQGLLNFHFVIYNLEHPYKDGFYYGLLELHENYPFAAPKLFFYTPSGRFETNLAICTSFTNYHQQTWTSAWNVRTLLLATVSFMTSQQFSYGCRNDSAQIRIKYAKNSLQWNLKNDKFCQYFLPILQTMNIDFPTSYLKKNKTEQKILNQVQPKHESLKQNGTDQQQIIEAQLNHQQLLPKQNDDERLEAQRLRNRRKIYFGILSVLLIAMILIICLH